MRILKTAGALLLLLGLTSCAAVPPPAPTPAATPARLIPHTTQQGDTIMADYRTDDFEIWISSEKGIGKANFERPGAPPVSVTFYMNLKGLEEFSLTWGDQTVTIHVPSSAGAPFPTVDPADPRAMPVATVAADPAQAPQGYYYVLTAPAEFIQDAPERFSVQWIDFYR